MSLQRFTVIQCSDFNALNRYVSGEDITPILEQRHDVGFNALRVWTAYDIDRIGRLIPREHPDIYARIPDFMQALADFELYAEITAFTGPYGSFFSTEQQMLDHWARLDAALEGCTNLLDLEVINEGDNSPNAGVPMDRMFRPIGKLSSHGSNSQDSTPIQPFWDVATWRSAAFEWQRKIGHGADEISDNTPVITNETVRCPDNDSDPQHFYDGAAGAALLCAGACFHSVHGKTSQLWDGQELVCAQAWVKGARSVPLDCQPGAYRHRDDLEGSGILRAYQRGTEDRCIVRIAP